MASEGDVPALLRRLRGRSRVAQAQAAAQLRQLAGSSAQCCEEIAAVGGVPPLLALLRAGSSGSSSGSSAAVQEHAGAVVRSVVQHCAGHLLGGSPAVVVAVAVQLLALDSHPAMQQIAADTLGFLASNSSEACSTVVITGGAAALARLLEPSRPLFVQAAAAQALFAVGLDGGSGVRDAIVASGAVPLLVSALQAMPPNLAGCQAVLCTGACGALHALAFDASGGTAEEEAARQRRHASIVEAGGLAALLRAVQETNNESMRAVAAQALWHLAVDDPRNKEALAARGGIPALVCCLGSSNATLQKMAANALAGLTAGSRPRQEATIAAGSTAALLAVLCRGGAQAPAGVLAVLANVGCVQGQARAILEAGATERIVRTIQQADSWESEAARGAAAVLFHLATKCAPDSHAAIAAAGGIPVLEQLLHRSQNVIARAAAAEALRALSTPPAAGQRPLRVCAAPDCTNSRRLNRCGGCGAVRYCSEACRDTHWREHRSDCRSLRAEQAAAAAAEAEAAGTSGNSQPACTDMS